MKQFRIERKIKSLGDPFIALSQLSRPQSGYMLEATEFMSDWHVKDGRLVPAWTRAPMLALKLSWTDALRLAVQFDEAGIDYLAIRAVVT